MISSACSTIILFCNKSGRELSIVLLEIWIFKWVSKIKVQMITVLKLERKNMFLLEVHEFIGGNKFVQIYFFNPLLKVLNIMTRHKLHLILLTWNSSKFDVSKFVFALISQLNYFPTVSNKDIILKILKAGTAQIEHVCRDAGANSPQSSRYVLSTYY